jgi:hypothetical protein
MKTLLATAAVLATIASANAADIYTNNNPSCQSNCTCSTTIAPPPALPPISPLPVEIGPPPPLGWIYGRYVDCPDGHPGHGCFINVRADGANVRRVPNGPVFLSLINGVPLVLFEWEGSWVHVGVRCNLRPTGLRSDTAHGVSLQTCQE